MIKRLLCTLFLISLVTACGGNNTPVTTACSIVLSGAVSKTLGCTAAIAYDAAHHHTVIGIMAPAAQDNIQEAVFEMALNGMGSTGTYAFASAVTAMANVYEGSGQYWFAGSQPALGSGSLALNSITEAVSVNGDNKVDTGSGSATATLVGQGAASGTVTMQVNFSIDMGVPATPATGGNIVATVRALPSQVFQAPKITPPSLATLPPLAAATAAAPTATPAAPTLPAATPSLLAPQADSGGACQFTLSGAVSKTVPCTVHMVYSAKEGNTGFEVISTERISSVPEASLIVTIQGEPKPAPVSYGWGDSQQQAASVYEGGIQAFAAASKNKRGESSVSFMSIEVTSTAEDGGKVYAPHGSGKATLVGPAGTVMLEVKF